METNNAIQTFNNEQFGSIRTMTIDGEPWFVGKDVASKLGYADTFGAIKKHVETDDKQNCQNDSFETPRGLTVINESGLYSLILSSKLPTAKQFKHWVTSEVLPTLRKTGTYSVLQKPDSYMIDNPVERAKRWIEEYEEKVVLEQTIEKQKPLVAFANRVSNASDCVDVGQLAKIANDEHINIGRNRLFDWLRQHNYIRKNYEPYQTYINQGIFKYKEYTYSTPYGEKIGKKLLITGKGQLHIIEKLRKEMQPAT